MGILHIAQYATTGIQFWKALFKLHRIYNWQAVEGCRQVGSKTNWRRMYMYLCLLCICILHLCLYLYSYQIWISLTSCWRVVAGWIKGNLKDVVLTASIHVETKHCKTLFINTLPPPCFPVRRGFEKYRHGKYLGRNSGNRSVGEISGGAIFGRDGVRKDRIVYSAEK